MAKTVKIGSVIIIKDEKTGKYKRSIGLGVKGKDPKYDLSVELVVKDSTGKVVAKQKDGFINLQDPRTLHDDLLEAGIITEETASKMRENAKKLPEKIKYQLVVSRS